MLNLNPFRPVLIGFIWLFIVCIFFSCGSERNSSGIENQNNLIVQMKWPSNSLSSENFKIFDEDICNDFGINNIFLNVYNSSDEFIANRNWPCSKHKGDLPGIPAGHGYKIHVEALVKDKPEWSSDVTNILVHEGKTFVEVAMKYIGSDTTPPMITTIVPKDKAAKVLKNTPIEITFSESLSHSSISESSILLYEGQTAIAGEISHTIMSSNIVFKPLSELKKSTTYTLKLTKDIKDCANLHMVDDKIISFTTVSKEPAPTPLNPPKKIKAIAGNGYVNLSWNAVSKANAYTIYMGEVSGVTKDPSLFQTVEVKAKSYEWAQLDNNKTYFFIVTAKNATEESNASAEVSATPSADVPFKKALTVYYDFIGGNAIDLSGNGNDGLITSATPTKDKLGKKDRALMFNGKDAYIEISPLSHFAKHHFTIAIVLKVDSFKKTQWILKKGAAAKTSFSLFLRNDGAKFPSCPFYSQPAAHGIYGKAFQYRLMANPPFPAKEFVHIAITLKSTQQYYSTVYVLKSYINGVPQKSFNNLPELFHSNSSLFIGKGGTTQLPCFFEGVIDDLLIYRRVLSSMEIRTLFEFSGVKNQVLNSDVHFEEDISDMDDDFDLFPQVF